MLQRLFILLCIVIVGTSIYLQRAYMELFSKELLQQLPSDHPKVDCFSISQIKISQFDAKGRLHLRMAIGQAVLKGNGQFLMNGGISYVELEKTGQRFMSANTQSAVAYLKKTDDKIDVAAAPFSNLKDFKNAFFPNEIDVYLKNEKLFLKKVNVDFDAHAISSDENFSFLGVGKKFFGKSFQYFYDEQRFIVKKGVRGVWLPSILTDKKRN